MQNATTTAPFFGTETAQKKPGRKSHKRTSYPRVEMAWTTQPESEQQYYDRLRLLAKAVISAKGDEVRVIECETKPKAAANAGHFARIANEVLGTKRGKVVVRASGVAVVAAYDRKAKRDA